MRYLAGSVAVALALVGQGQNLVPNGSFEQYDACPTYFGLAGWCTGWMNLHTQSADYFNACHTSGVVGVPLNQFGYQYPADGDGYMGMCTYIYNQWWYREVIGVQLTEPLQIGVPVCLSFKIAVGGFGTSVGNSAGYTSKGVGMKFFNVIPDDWLSYLYPNSAALYLDEVPTDTAIWYQLEGTYMPDSAYNYVLIANFFADSLSEATVQDSIGFSSTDWSYAFIDDVRASFDLNYCLLDLEVPEIGSIRPMPYPMPFAECLSVRMPMLVQGPVEYALRDVAGRSIQRGSAEQVDGEVVIPATSLPDGAYLLQLNTTQQSWGPLTVVHISP